MTDTAVIAAEQPGPEDPDDLLGILQHVAPRAYPDTRQRLVRSAETRAFLELGLRILSTDLLDHAGPDMEQGEHSRIFGMISKERLLAEARKSSDGRIKYLTESQFKTRWPHKNEYTEDLIAYLFRPGPYHAHLDEMAAVALQMSQRLSLGELIEQLAEAEMTSVLADVRVSLITVLQSALPNHPKVREYVTSHWYSLVLGRWSKIYEATCGAYGLQTRPGIVWNDLAVLFNAVIDGATLRARTEGTAATTSSGQPVLAAAIFAMIPSLLDLQGRDPYDIRSVAASS